VAGTWAGILGRVPAPTADTLATVLRPFTDAPFRAAILCDIDGTLAPIVERPEDAKVPGELSRRLGQLSRRYLLLACVSGRAATEARRLVGVGRMTYAGSHGAEILDPGASRPRTSPDFADWAPKVHAFADGRDRHELRRLRVRVEDKGPIVAFHWRGAPDEDAARAAVERIAAEAGEAGLAIHWGRKVLEVRPPVEISKGRAVRELVERAGARAALFGGDDATDLDAWDALDELLAEGLLDTALRVGVRSDEAPDAIVERADLVVDGVPGFGRVLEGLAVR
jgi:trehalose 6-phosphate phosphatase